MAKEKSKSTNTVEMDNATVMAQLVVDPNTTETLRVKILNKLLDSRDNEDFFPTMKEEAMSLGNCPCCGHTNHWLIPEDVLNKLGWVTSEQDPEVPEHTNADICPEWAQACKKKRVSI